MPPVERLPVKALRELFNAEVLPKIRNGELLEYVASENRPSLNAHQAPGTKSQIVEYWGTDGSKMIRFAIVHRYLRPDGSLGGSGLPDPKEVVHEGTKFRPERPPSRR